MDETGAIDVPIGQDTARPAPATGWLAEATRAVCAAYLRLTGWRVRGDWPDIGKAVLVAAPHTSNWDGINMLATAGYYRVRLRWMGKQSLTRGPFGGLVRWLGCVPVDRSGAHDLVRSMAETFAREDRMILAVPPEGTRSAVRDWKSGFYHIARAANVPLILSVLDYGTRTVRLAAIVTPSGDYAADLPVIRRYYAGAAGLRRAQFLDAG